MAQNHRANRSRKTNDQSSAEAASCQSRQGRISRALCGDGRWRMPGFFAAAMLATAVTFGALAAVADPAGISGGLAPILVPHYMTYPVMIVVGA